jgi:hypothetical protein
MPLLLGAAARTSLLHHGSSAAVAADFVAARRHRMPLLLCSADFVSSVAMECLTADGKTFRAELVTICKEILSGGCLDF